MTTIIEYALMAGASYISTRSDINQFPVPDGWFERIDKRQELPSGFEATYFTNGTNIVISYAGTYDKDASGDGIADIELGAGLVNAQLFQAAEYYMQVKAANPDANITLTGHSLGGGLASLVAVFFNETAMTFDQAPFRNSASWMWATVLRSDLEEKFPVSAYPQINDWLASLDRFIDSFDPLGLGWSTDGLDAREANVTNLSVDGEFLNYTPALRIGSELPALTHGDYSGPLDLHSQALLTAFLQSIETAGAGQGLNQVTFELSDLLTMIFDENLFAYTTDKTNTQITTSALVAQFFRRITPWLTILMSGRISGVISSAARTEAHSTAEIWKTTSMQVARQL
jgi:hypothetical protein